MKVKYTQIADSIYQILVEDGLENLLQILDKNLDYFNNWPNGDQPNLDLPYDSKSVLAPKHYFILSKKSSKIDNIYLDKLLTYQIKFPLLVQDIYFLSKDWLVLDEHKIIKAEGDVNYMFVKNELVSDTRVDTSHKTNVLLTPQQTTEYSSTNKLYKVFEKNCSLLTLIDINDIGPNTWLWRIEM